MDIKGEINFTSIERIGDLGWNGEVLRGFDPQLSTELAFKRIAKKGLNDDPARFFEEAQMIQKARHANIVEIKYACADADNIWLAMPLYQNGSLQGVLNRRTLTSREVIRYGIDLLRGLQHVHSQKLVHLDVKPANILLSDSDTALLADFGCTRIMDDQFLVDPVAAYPLHQVPERFKASKLGLEADIYQAGLTLYRLCNGDALFFSSIGGHKTSDEIKDNKVRNKVNEKIKSGKYPDRSSFLPHVPKRLRLAICKALALNPDDRFRSAAEFIDALSVVDTGLDWQFSESPQGLSWTLDGASMFTRIQMIPSTTNATVTITSTKTNKLTGNTQRSIKHCGQRATRAEALKWITEIAKELDEV